LLSQEKIYCWKAEMPEIFTLGLQIQILI